MSNNPAAAVAALVDSLREDPFYLAISVDYAANDERRRGVLTEYFDYSLTEGERIGRKVVVDGPAAGAAAWVLPVDPAIRADIKEAKTRFLARALGPQGNANYHRIVGFMGPRAAAVVEGDAWYLSIVGVSPSAQGRGIGAKLLERTLAEADAVQAACYLETFTPRSLNFYRRLGFEPRVTHLEPTTGCEYTLMTRVRAWNPGLTRAI
jgi:ribosomal protein S18 acetylase RimI-like enzyme